jgi:hypothetical protein
MSARVLERRTGEGVEVWNARIAAEGPADKPALQQWLTERGVTGYAQSLLVMERFGYPEFMTTPGAALIDAQYAGYAALRPIYDAVVEAALPFGGVAVQARKTYVCLVTPRRTFARIQAAKTRVHVALRLDGQSAEGRLQPSRVHADMPVQLSLERVEDLDAEAREWLRRAYLESS